MGENKYNSFEEFIIATPMCDEGACSNAAVYEFTDVILADPDKKLEDRKTKRITLGRACDIHYIEVKSKYVS